MNIVWNKVTWYSKALALVVFLLVLVLGVYIGAKYQEQKDLSLYSDFSEYQQTLNQTPVSPEAPSTPTTSGSTYVKLFYVAVGDNGTSGKKVACGDSVVGLIHGIPKTSTPLNDALELLLSDKRKSIGESGLFNPLYQSNLKVEGVSITNGKATVKLSGNFVLAGSCSDYSLVSQITETVMQFPTIKQADITINGRSLASWLDVKGE